MMKKPGYTGEYIDYEKTAARNFGLFRLLCPGGD
jgi:hypothetical protein